MTVRSDKGFVVSHGSAKADCEICDDGSVYVTGFQGDPDDPYAAVLVLKEGHTEAERMGAPRFLMHVAIEDAAGRLGEMYEKAGFRPKFVIYEKELWAEQ